MSDTQRLSSVVGPPVERPTYVLPQADSALEALLREPIEAEPEPEGVRLAATRVVDARVSEVDDEWVYVDLGDGAFGRCAIEEARPVGQPLHLKSGDAVRCLLEEEMDEGRWRVSIGKVPLLDRAAALEAAARDRATVTGTIHRVVRGGFAAEVDGLYAFLPARESGIRFVDSFEAIGRTYAFQVLELDGRTGAPVLSRRELADEQRRDERAAILERLKEGERIEGVVRSVQKFGAFVDIGGIDGLLHVSEMSLQHVDNPASVVREGDVITVVVTEIDRNRGKVGLSRRELLMDDWKQRLAAFKAGEIYAGRVTRLADFGAFVELAPGIEGLCHISELSWRGRVEHPSEIVESDNSVRVKVLEIDPEKRRIALSIRQTEENPWGTFAGAHAAGAVVRGTITRIEDYGLFIQVAPGVEGLCHVGELTWEGRPEKPQDAGSFAVGNAIEAKILDIDLDRQRLSLGIRQLTRDPWDDAGDRVQVGTIFTGRVARLDGNLAFVEVAPGLEGRMHISEVSTERVESLRAALRPGQEIEVMTTESDRQRRRLSVSIKAVLQKMEAESPRTFQDATSLNPLADALARSGILGGTGEKP